MRPLHLSPETASALLVVPALVRTVRRREIDDTTETECILRLGKTVLDAVTDSTPGAGLPQTLAHPAAGSS